MSGSPLGTVTVGLYDIDYNPITEVPDDNWAEVLRDKPKVYDWSYDLLLRSWRQGNTNENTKNEGPVPDAYVEQATLIDDIVNQGIAQINDSQLKMLARSARLLPARLWVWEQSEGEGAEALLLELLLEAVSDWPLQDCSPKRLQKIAGKRIAMIEKTMAMRLHERVLVGFEEWSRRNDAAGVR